MVGILNTQVGRPLSVFRQRDQYAVGRARSTICSTAPRTQAGLKQVIAERQQADLGTTGLGRLVIIVADADLGAGGAKMSPARRSA